MVGNLALLILVLGVIALFSTKIGSSIIDYFSFYVEGQKSSFSAAELHLLWQVAKKTNLKHRTRLFWSVTALNEAIGYLSKQVASEIDESEN